ncbi:MAG: sulfite exporter TauE/SafE family protein [Phycisphaeraceae bacterium]|nr:sulfite exporter TauE/SafE family protein [Phycisphaeraceae bacterium]MBX3368108.1 sulfite exporter TauE/SafE family protein [Phycisphaeraceae bacterium]
MITAWIGAILIGLSLGLLGSGGSILTVPILVYLVKHPEKQAIAESLAIVGAIACFGAIREAIKRHVVWRAVAWFGIPGIGGSLLGAYLARFIPGEVQLVMLGAIMLVAAARMAGTSRAKQTIGDRTSTAPSWLLVLIGFGLGLITGLVGIGGGFLIVPALVLLAGVPMKHAVGTSLTLIVVNCVVGFAKYQVTLATFGMGIDWNTILVFSFLGMLGSIAGAAIGSKLNQRVLRQVFAAFLLAMAVFIIWRQMGKL